MRVYVRVCVCMCVSACVRAFEFVYLCVCLLHVQYCTNIATGIGPGRLEVVHQLSLGNTFAQSSMGTDQFLG